MPARIALILTEFPPALGGMQTHAAALAQGLLDAGWLFEVYTYRLDEPQLLAEAAQFDAQCGYPVHRCLSRIGFWANHSLLYRQLHQRGIALIYASNVYYGLLGAALKIPVLCRSVGNDVQRPWIAYPYRLGSRIVSHPKLEGPLHRLYRRCNTPEWIEAVLRRARQRLMRQAAQGNRLILANSHYTAGLLQANGITRDAIRILVGGVDHMRYANSSADPTLRAALGIAPDARIVLTACRLVAKKGLDFLLGNWAQLREIDPRLHLLIVGDGRERKRCQAQIDALGLQAHVTLAGRVPQPEMPRYFALAEVFILASRISVNRISGLSDAETMGRVLCEANAAGVPVIASRSGGIPSVISDGDNGLLFEPDNAAELLLQMTRLLSDATLRERLIQRGLERAKQEFDWPHILAAHQQAFDDVQQMHV